MKNSNTEEMKKQILSKGGWTGDNVKKLLEMDLLCDPGVFVEPYFIWEKVFYVVKIGYFDQYDKRTAIGITDKLGFLRLFATRKNAEKLERKLDEVIRDGRF